MFKSTACKSISTAIAAAGLALGAASCGEHASAQGGGGAATRPAQAAQPIPVQLAPVDRTPIADTVDFVGTLYGDEEAQISSKVAGRVVAVLADLGDRVDDGAPIARVDPTDYQLEVQRRELALREALSKVGLETLPPESFDITTVATVRRAAVQAQNAKARLDRARQLFEQPQPLISPQEFADTETQFQVAQQDYDVAVLEVRSSIALAQSRAAELAVARQQLADTEIRAPQPGEQAVSGRWAVAERRTSVGEYVQPGTVVFRLLTDRPIKLRSAVPERYLSRIARGQEVALRVESSDAATRGEVSRVSPAVDVASRTFIVEMTFPNADGALKPGSFGRGTITVGQRTDVTTIPAAALYTFAGLNRVFTVKDGKAVAHAVEVVRSNSERVVIGGNLGGAGEVVVGGLAKLANGVPVTLAK